MAAVTAGAVAIVAAGVTAGVTLSPSGNGKSPEAATGTGITGADRLRIDRLSEQIRAAANLRMVEQEEQREAALAHQRKINSEVNALGRSAAAGMLRDAKRIAGTRTNDTAAVNITPCPTSLDFMYQSNEPKVADVAATLLSDSSSLTLTSTTDQGKGNELNDDGFAVTFALSPAAKRDLSGKSLTIPKIEKALGEPGTQVTSIDDLPVGDNQDYPAIVQTGASYDSATLTGKVISSTVSQSPLTEQDIAAMRKDEQTKLANLAAVISSPPYAY